MESWKITIFIHFLYCRYFKQENNLYRVCLPDDISCPVHSNTIYFCLGGRSHRIATKSRVSLVYINRGWWNCHLCPAVRHGGKGPPGSYKNHYMKCGILSKNVYKCGFGMVWLPTEGCVVFPNWSCAWSVSSCWQILGQNSHQWLLFTDRWWILTLTPWCPRLPKGLPDRRNFEQLVVICSV